LENRIRKLNNIVLDDSSRPVVYWMSRDQRVNDNWALVIAHNEAHKTGSPLVVVFNLLDNFLKAQNRQFYFMLLGLKKVQNDLEKLNINFMFTKGLAENEILKLVKKVDAKLLISDFSPLKIKTEWNEKIIKNINIPYWEVDAHNIIPPWTVSDKQEYAAYTIRPKINKLLNHYLIDIPKLQKHKFLFKNKFGEKITDDLVNEFKTDLRFKSGEDEANNVLKIFVENNLDKYKDYKNNPNKNVLSNLSLYLHFGQISAQRVALKIHDEVFLEELIVRRELAENYCFYNKNYDNFEGFPNWAQKTLEKHKNDKREYLYSLEQFELAQTHDLLWNAAQKEMVVKGKMHGYLRMYWAKKILEWTKSVQEAQKIAIYLNDKYEIDGRDPNGYAGIAWSIGGVHDRPWFERKIFGQVRYMSENGMKRKFNTKEYIDSNL